MSQLIYLQVNIFNRTYNSQNDIRDVGHGRPHTACMTWASTGDQCPYNENTMRVESQEQTKQSSERESEKGGGRVLKVCIVQPEECGNRSAIRGVRK